jgi:AcrR family transcriptional regulator
VATAPSRERTKELVGVAARLFRDRGYDATTMQNIANEMGILKGSLYHYVETKEDLLWMIVEAPLMELNQAVGEILAATSTPVMTRLRRAVETHAVSFEKHHPHMFVITRENGETLSTQRKDAIAALRSEYYGLWRKAILEGMTNGELRPDLNPGVTVQAIFGMLSWMFRWYTPGGRLSATEVADQFSAILSGGLVAEPDSAPVEPA